MRRGQGYDAIVKCYFFSGAVLLCLSGVPAEAQSRLQAPRLQQVHGYSGVGGLSGVGERRALPNAYQFRSNPLGGRAFGQSFDLKTNEQFMAHTLDNPEEMLRTTSLYNNPWYWQNVGSLETEMMTGGTGVPVSDMVADGDYYNPAFYHQWKSTGGMRHVGAMTSEIGRDPGFGPTGSVLPPDEVNQRDWREDRNLRDPRQDGPALLPGTNAPVVAPTTQQGRVGELAADRSILAGDRLGSNLRSGIDDTWSGNLARQVGRGINGEQRVVYLGSSLRGLVTEVYGPSSPSALGLSSWDLARRRNDRLDGRRMSPPGRPWDTRMASLTQEASRVASERLLEPSELPRPENMTEVYEAMAARYDALHPSTESLEDRLKALDRDYHTLRGTLIVGPTGQMPQEEPPLVPAEVPISDSSPTIPTDETQGESPTSVILADRPETTLSWPDFDVLLRHGRSIDALAVGDGSRFDDLMLAGANALAEGRYLVAERRFNRALRFIPGHPLAMAGVGHAQLGGGLYLSAALTLQSLLAFQPELIDVTWGQDVLPDQESIDRAIAVLGSRLAEGTDLDRWGFLLAYIGHQRDRPDLIEEGLDAMRQGGADPAFVEVLSEIWGPVLDQDQ